MYWLGVAYSYGCINVYIYIQKRNTRSLSTALFQKMHCHATSESQSNPDPKFMQRTFSFNLSSISTIFSFNSSTSRLRRLWQCWQLPQKQPQLLQPTFKLENILIVDAWLNKTISLKKINKILVRPKKDHHIQSHSSRLGISSPFKNYRTLHQM